MSWIFLFQECGRPPVDPEVITVFQTDTVIKMDTIRESYPAPYPVNHYDTVLREVDSAKIIADYVVKREYNIKLVPDSIGDLHLESYVQFNRLQDYTVLGHIKQVTITNTVNSMIREPPRNKVFAGLMFIAEPLKVSMAPSITLLSKRDKLYKVGYDPFYKTIYAEIGFKISFRR